MNRLLSTLMVVGLAGPALADGRTTLVAATSVPVEQDGCLDHTVKELGMSAKRKDKERKWNIGPQFVHPSLLPDGTVQVELNRVDPQSAITITLTWSGPLKEKAIQSEIEQRAVAMAGKMAQMCGVTKPTVKCTTTVGSTTAACAQ